MPVETGIAHVNTVIAFYMEHHPARDLLHSQDLGSPGAAGTPFEELFIRKTNQMNSNNVLLSLISGKWMIAFASLARCV